MLLDILRGELLAGFDKISKTTVKILTHFFLNFQERHEAQDVVAQLREELRLSKQQNEKFKQMINAKDKDDFLKKYSEQNENVSCQSNVL